MSDEDEVEVLGDTVPLSDEMLDDLLADDTSIDSFEGDDLDGEDDDTEGFRVGGAGDDDEDAF